MLNKIYKKFKNQKNASHEAMIDFIRANKQLYETQFGETALSLIMQRKLMILMIFFLSAISLKYFGATQDWRFLAALVPVSFTAFFHPIMGRFLSKRNQYLVLYIHIFFYILYNIWNQVALQLYYPAVVSNEQFVMIVFLTLMLSSFIATSPYFSRTLLLNGALLCLYMAGMLYTAKLRQIDILRHAVQGLGLGGALSFVMMTIYRYRVYFIVQENTLRDRAEKIQSINTEIVTMQDTMPACILKIDESLRIVYASKTEEFLGLSDMQAMSLIEFIALIGENDVISADIKEQFHQALQATIGENYAIGYPSNEDKFIQEFQFNTRPVSAKYGAHVDSDGNVEYLLLAILDNSAKIQGEKQKIDSEIILALAEHLQKASGFIVDACFFVSRIEALVQLYDDPNALLELRRNLHTFKGLARTLGFGKLATTLHEAESLSMHGLLENRDRLLKKVGSIKTLSDNIRHLAETKLQIRLDDKMIVLSFTESQIVEAYLKNQLDSIVLAQACYSLKSAITFFEASLTSQAQQQGKDAPILIVNSPEIYLLKENAKSLDGIFGHILSNAIDHGIETAKERTSLNPPKNPRGQILVNIAKKNQSIMIRISDDGRGLALKKIREKAIMKGLIAEMDRLDSVSIAKLIFLPSFSTQDNLSETSGRGVGLDAVKSSVEALGGRIDIELYGEESSFAPWVLIIELADRMIVNKETRASIRVA